MRRNSPAFTRLMYSGTSLTDPISLSILSTISFAPPCSGPYKAAAAPASVQNEQHAQCAFEYRVRLVGQLSGLEHHVQEISFVTEIVVRISVLHANAMPVSKSRDGWDFGD